MHSKIAFSLTVTALLLTGCGTSSEPTAQGQAEEPPEGMFAVKMPDWYNATKTADASEGALYGYGMAESDSRRLAVESAQAEGRRAIAGYIATEAAGLLEESVTDMGSDATETARAAFETFVDERVYGVRPDRSALYKDGDGQYVAYYRMRADEAIFDEMLQSAIEDDNVEAALDEQAHEEAMQMLEERRQSQGDQEPSSGQEEPPMPKEMGDYEEALPADDDENIGSRPAR
ncbi:hypothetical protein SAMN05660831_00079 [Thiohalospira halophila DSM 15071]|uniref:LPP20 lipoprotein n=1 Tax=Thiohalospira halophila DSM 15071 TaxID=1123397 RepID=A0A1I1N2H9_9GAMM|nr:hypothetical protein [Thiohalospira halophila]SFC91874.1 hypothetical protein SAMN05660831_00079 [Thiohalospira halophila DSM 15071]